jgi:hypothetical protein
MIESTSSRGHQQNASQTAAEASRRIVILQVTSISLFAQAPEPYHMGGSDLMWQVRERKRAHSLVVGRK